MRLVETSTRKSVQEHHRALTHAGVCINVVDFQDLYHLV